MQTYAAVGGRDTLTCVECGARWHLCTDWRYQLKWAELEIPSRGGKGAELLGRKLKSDEWRKICSEAWVKEPSDRTSVSAHQTIIKEKETIIKEVVMIPCQYCGGLMPQASVFCPNCGAKRNR
jgi:hypothetical protein